MLGMSLQSQASLTEKDKYALRVISLYHEKN